MLHHPLIVYLLVQLPHPSITLLVYSIQSSCTYLCHYHIHSLHPCATPSTHCVLTCSIAASIHYTLGLLHPVILHLLVPLPHPFITPLCYSIHSLCTYLFNCRIHPLHSWSTPSSHLALTCAIATSIHCILVLLHPPTEHLLVLLPHLFITPLCFSIHSLNTYLYYCRIHPLHPCAALSNHCVLTYAIVTSIHCILVLLHPPIEYLLVRLPHSFVTPLCYSIHWALTCAIATTIHCILVLLHSFIEHLIVLLQHPFIAHLCYTIYSLCIYLCD